MRNKTFNPCIMIGRDGTFRGGRFVPSERCIVFMRASYRGFGYTSFLTQEGVHTGIRVCLKRK